MLLPPCGTLVSELVAGKDVLFRSKNTFLEEERVFEDTHERSRYFHEQLIRLVFQLIHLIINFIF